MAENKRKPNLTTKEKETIVNIALKYKNVIENKCTDAVTLTQKARAWDKVTSDFNANSCYKRTTKQIKAFYKNSKCNIKKELAANKVEIYKTGGGTVKHKLDENNPFLALVLSETTPIKNEFDSSCDYLEDKVVKKLKYQIL